LRHQKGIDLYASEDLKILLKIQWIFVILLSLFAIGNFLGYILICWRSPWSEKGCKPLSYMKVKDLLTINNNFACHAVNTGQETLPWLSPLAQITQISSRLRSLKEASVATKSKSSVSQEIYQQSTDH